MKWVIKNLGIILNIVVLIFAVAMAYVPLRWDVIERGPDNKIKKLTLAGYIFLSFAVCAIGFGIWKIVNDDGDMQEIKSNLKDLGLKIERTTITPIDTARPHVYPAASVYGHPQNPFLEPPNGRARQYDLSLCNDGTGTATNLVEKEVLIEYFNDHPPIFRPRILSLVNKSTEIGVNRPGVVLPLIMNKPVIDPKQPIPTATFWYFALAYTNLRSQTHDTLRKIWELLPDDRAVEAFGQQYDSAMNDLRKNNYW